MASRGGSRAVLAAAKKANSKSDKVNFPAYASKGSIVNKQIKANLTPASSSNLGKFLGIRDPPRSDITRLVTKFVKLNNRENPRIKKNLLTEEHLKKFLAGKDRVGVPEIVKLLNQQ